MVIILLWIIQGLAMLRLFDILFFFLLLLFSFNLCNYSFVLHFYLFLGFEIASSDS